MASGTRFGKDNEKRKFIMGDKRQEILESQDCLSPEDIHHTEKNKYMDLVNVYIFLFGHSTYMLRLEIYSFLN